MSFDTEIAARTAWMEGRGEPEEGWKAIIWAILNRHSSNRWYAGATLAQTCLLSYQFSCWNTADPNRKAMAALAENDPLLGAMRKYLLDAQSGYADDPTKGATHYYAPHAVRVIPPWAKPQNYVGDFGSQKFYKSVA